MRQFHTKPFTECATIWERSFAILPFGSVESHGPHLPLDTDTRILEAILEQVSSESCIQLPTIPYSPVNRERTIGPERPGMIDIRPEIFANYVTAIVGELSELGCQRVVFVTWHDTADHIAVLRRVALEARNHGVVIDGLRLWPVALRWFASRCCIEMSEERHAAGVETSMMLRLYPSLVRPFEPKKTTWATPLGEVLETPQPLRSGVYGRLDLARPEVGKDLMEYIVSWLSQELGKRALTASHGGHQRVTL